MAAPKPDYLSRDYAGMRQSLLQYAQQVFPEWQPSSQGDFGVVMVDLFSYMSDILSYYTDRAQFENYLPTATQRDSILNIAFMLGYVPNSGTPARGTVPLTTDKGTAALVVPAGTQITTNRVKALDGPVVFETDDEVVLPANADGTAASVSVPVTEGKTETFEYLGESNGQPGQVFMLPHTGVYRGTVKVYVEDIDGTNIINEGSNAEVKVREWVRVPRLLEGDRNDKIFETRFTETSMLVYFGDDINGAIPATGLKVYATYRHGFGAAGNVGAGLVRLINTKGQQGLGAVKVAVDANGLPLSSAMMGGADPESNDSIRYNAPRVYRTQNRAVTEQDFVEVALGTEGVAKASVLAGTFTSVTLFIVAADGGVPSEPLKKAVADRLADRTLAGVTVTVSGPEYVPIRFGTVENPIEVEIKKSYSNKTVAAAIRRAIRQFVSDMPFGAKMSVGKIYRVIQEIEGVESVDIPVLVRQDADEHTGHAKITPKAWEIFSVNNISLNVTGGVA